ncbi:hypothetical protein MMC08_008531 [Hypocenomyce scalaris]|nr:hypothetical protein [Hypocenomyce scalaris]
MHFNIMFVASVALTARIALALPTANQDPQTGVDRQTRRWKSRANNLDAVGTVNPDLKRRQSQLVSELSEVTSCVTELEGGSITSSGIDDCVIYVQDFAADLLTSLDSTEGLSDILRRL